MTTAAGHVGQTGVDRPPVAVRRQATPAHALSEEITDSLRLLVLSLGAVAAVAVLLVVLTTTLG